MFDMGAALDRTRIESVTILPQIETNGFYEHNKERY